MSVQETIETKISDRLTPEQLQVINESRMHSVPPNSETHFKVVVVSKNFEGVMSIDRHRTINDILAVELKEKIHALSLHTFTPEEWEAKGRKAKQSPDCRGGSKAD